MNIKYICNVCLAVFDAKLDKCCHCGNTELKKIKSITMNNKSDTATLKLL